MSGWPRKFRTYWCVVDEAGKAFLVSACASRPNSMRAFLKDADPLFQNWGWWKRRGYTCQRVDVKVRTARP